MLIDIIAAERTDFIKIASLVDAIRNEQTKGSGIRYRLIYTGNYNDPNLSPHFFDQLNILRPNINLETGKALSDVEQTAIVMVRYEKVLSLGKPHLVLITGDSNATIACAITAKKTHNIPVGHIESGIRNHDLFTTVEINRVLSDSITDYYFTASHSANENLRKMGVPDEKIFFVGNTRIDALLKLRQLYQQPELWTKLKLKAHNYVLLCLHSKRNMKPHFLKELLEKINTGGDRMPLIFPADRAGLKIAALAGLKPPALYPVNLLEYPEFIFLLSNARLVITDYAGIQEETTVLNVPCITLGNNAGMQETISSGTNFLAPDMASLTSILEKIDSGKMKKGNIPYQWDGNSASRIMSLIKYIDAERKK